jgi:hypothetical protein
MFLVVSRWQALPGKEEEFERQGRELGAITRSQPGVLLVETFRSGDHIVSVHGYADEGTYDRIVQAPDSIFARELESRRMYEIGRWLGSERGETESH